MKGFSGIYEKPLSKELQKYREKDEEALWVNIGAFTNANYLGANGLKVINSTNLYPNLKLWHRIDEDREYEDIYNRYAHIEMNLTNNETTFELVQPDSFEYLLENLRNIFHCLCEQVLRAESCPLTHLI